MSGCATSSSGPPQRSFPEQIFRLKPEATDSQTAEQIFRLKPEATDSQTVEQIFRLKPEATDSQTVEQIFRLKRKPRIRKPWTLSRSSG
jgi:hypothetical protein